MIKKGPAFAGYKICSYVLAVAFQSEELLKTCHSSNNASLHDVAMIGMPKNAGKKPMKRYRKRKSVRDENRVPPLHGCRETLITPPTHSETNNLCKPRTLPTATSIPSGVSLAPNTRNISSPPPLVPITHGVTAQVLQINQQPSLHSHTSMTVTQPFCSLSVPPLNSVVNYLPQK